MIHFWTCLVGLCRSVCLQLRLHVVNGHINLYQLYNNCWFWVGKGCIGLCQYFQIVALCLHAPHNCLNVIYWLMMLFWRGRRCTIYFFTIAVYPPFPEVVTALLCSWCDQWNNRLYFSHVFWSVVWRLHSWMSSLKIPDCAKWVIPLEIIM